MKKFLITLSILLIAFQGFSQRLKYKDDLHRILTLPVGGEIAELTKWLGKEPTNPSIFLQMALVYEERYNVGDPLKDFAYKIGNAKLALSAYERTEQFITEKDVKKNEESYYNFGVYDAKGKFNVPFDSVQNRITKSKAELKEYIAKTPEIYNQFTQSFSNYDQAHKIYSEILGKYPTFKNLYLLHNESLDQEFEHLKTEYLTAVDHFQKYIIATDSFNIGYKQKLTINEISIYRLDGLESEINFLKEEIEMWDYAKWVDETRVKISEEIGDLRASLVAENLRINTKLKSALPDYIREKFEPLVVSKEVLFNLRKYDLNAVIEPIFIYKQKKHDLIYQELLNESIDTSTTVDVERKLYLHGQMINKVKLADSTLSDIKRRNTEASYQKHSEFINTYYEGTTGIKQFANKEMDENATKVRVAVEKIEDYILEKVTVDTTQSDLIYRKLKIPQLVSKPIENEFLTTKAISTHRVNTFDGSLILGGIYHSESEDKTQGFVCGVTPEKKVAWYNDYLLQQDSSKGFDSNTRVAAMTLVPGGVAFILNGNDSTGTKQMNHLMILNENGEITLSKRLLLSQYPRFINYSSSGNTLLVAYKGDEFSETILKESELIVASYSILGDLQWQKRKSFKGDLTGVFEVDDSYILVGNFSEMKDETDRILRAGAKSTETNAYTLKISKTGEIDDLKTIDHDTSFYTSLNYKVSDDCLNIFGAIGKYQSSNKVDRANPKMMHLIINSDLEVLYNSLK